jgi:hypothetical protein
MARLPEVAVTNRADDQADDQADNRRGLRVRC